MLNKSELQFEMFTRCLDELYRAAQPSITYEEFEKISKKHPKDQIFKRYYLSSEEQKFIIDKFIDIYNLKSNFKEHCDLLIDNITKGCFKDKYIKPKDGSPGYRSYEDVPPLKDIIGEEAVNKIVEFIKTRCEFYRFDRIAENFKFNVFNIAPNTNKEAVLKYWESIGKPITIEDRDPEYNYERYYLGYSEEEIENLKNE